MRRLESALPAIILTLYITTGNMTGFPVALMRSLSVVAFVVLAAVAYAKRKGAGVSPVEKGFLIYMAFGVITYSVLPGILGPLMACFPTGLLYVSLFLTAAVPALAGGSYFTEYFAKKTTPEAVWETDVFKTINRTMTWVWAALFALSAFVTAIPFLFGIEGSLMTGIIFQIALPMVLLAGIGIPFNRKYPLYYQRKIGLEPPVEEVRPNMGGVEIPRPMAEKSAKEEFMSYQFKIVALNGSPHEAIGNTSQMIQMVASALAVEGGTLEEISLAGKEIGYCIGCGACLEKGGCWRKDDHKVMAEALLGADGIILASPVYFGQATGQMKVFLDRSLGLGHKPRGTWKPGLAISVSAGKGETATAEYLARCLHVYGAYGVGTLTAIATNPGAFLGREYVEARAGDLARDLARAIKEKRRYPATDEDLAFYLFMRDLVTREKQFMSDDYDHWQTHGLLDGFESYTGQHFSAPNFDPAVRKEWLKETIREANAKRSGKAASSSPARPNGGGPSSAGTCRELIESMPLGFNGEAAGDIAAVYQFEITGAEEFSGFLDIAAGTCAFHEGRHSRPDVVIESPADVWLAVSRGELDGRVAFMSGKYKVQGDITLLMKLNSLFSR